MQKAVSRSDVSVIICAYTEARWEDLVAAVESIRQQEAPAREIIVVVDHNPRLLDRVRSHLRDIVVVENQEAQGLSGSRNSGIAVAHHPIIAFLDDDGVAAPDWLSRLTTHYQVDDVIGVGGSIDPMWLDKRPSWFPTEFNWVVGCTYKGMPETVAPVRNMIGCNMSFRREVFDAVGGFTHGIGRVGTRPVGCEETELCIRVNQRWPQKLLLYDPAALVLHRVPSARGRWSYFCSRCYSEGLSKALVAREVGKRDALSSEKSYVTRILPVGIARGLVQVVALRNPSAGLGQIITIIAGIIITSFGYMQGTLTLGLVNRREHSLVSRL